jgi:hypothetical protein
MSGNSKGLDPACSEDDERKESVVWMKVRASSDNFTINNGKPYIGSGAAAANTKDYTIYSGSCDEMKQIACHTLRGNTSATIHGLQSGLDYYILASPAITQTKAEAISICITSDKAYKAPGDACAEANEIQMNSMFIGNNAGASADGPESSFSIENNTWYKWKTPMDWIPGQAAYLRVFEPVCNSSEGLQILLWNTKGDCPDMSRNPSFVSKAPGSSQEYYHQWSPIAGNTYYISVDGYAGTACQFRLELRSQSVMPVNLITLDAKSKVNAVQLTWVTAEEGNNSFFTLEKSRNGQDFISVSKIDGAGKSTTERSYNYQDDYPFSDVNYYRLKQTDIKGDYSYSKTVAVNVKGSGNLFHTKADKNGSQIDVAYFSPEAGPGMLRIYNKSGQQMYNMNLYLNPGHNDYKISSQLFPEGEYHLKLETPTAIVSGNVLLEDK